MQQLFGQSLSVFVHRFNHIFYVKYMSKNIIRIYDNISHSVVINCKVPFVISKTCNLKLIHSLYIHIFKYECGLDYDKYDCDYYEHVKRVITDYIENIYTCRLKIIKNIDKLSEQCSLETCNNQFFKRSPSHFLKSNVNILIKLNDTFNYYNDFSSSFYHQSSIYI